MSLEAVKRNGHNLMLGKFESVGEYDIPKLFPVHMDERIDWIRFNHSLNEPPDRRSKIGVQFFIDDYLFQRIWTDPPRYAGFLREFDAVLTPDFSTFGDYPKAVNLYNHWRKHYLGAFWQRSGCRVIPSVSWVDKDSYSWCFDGEPEGATVAVSSVGAMKNPDARKMFIDGYNEMLIRLQPEKIIFFGNVPDECTGNIEHHSPYYETFVKGLAFSDKER